MQNPLHMSDTLTKIFSEPGNKAYVPKHWYNFCSTSNDTIKQSFAVQNESYMKK